jgi:hypothetical protein
MNSGNAMRPPERVPATPGAFAFDPHPVATPLAHQRMQRNMDTWNRLDTSAPDHFNLNASSIPAPPSHAASSMQKKYLDIEDWLTEISASNRRSRHDHTDYLSLIQVLIIKGIYTTREFIRLGISGIEEITGLEVGDAARMIEWAEEDRDA